MVNEKVRERVTPPVLLTVAEAARRLSLSRSKVYALIARGEIESVKVDGSRRVPADALVAYVRGLR